MTSSKLSLKARALQLLARREHSNVELRHQLTRHAAAALKAEREAESGPAPTTAAAFGAVDERPDDTATIARRVDEVLGWLQSNRFSSDERFAESRVHARLARFGNLRIRDELSRHGVAPGDELAQRLGDSELQRAQQVWSNRFGKSSDADDAAAEARQYRFLASRGFSSDVYRQTLRHAAREKACGAAANQPERRAIR